MEPGLKGLQRLIYRGRLKELNLCCLAKQQLMGEGWDRRLQKCKGRCHRPGPQPRDVLSSLLEQAGLGSTLLPRSLRAPSTPGHGRRLKSHSSGTR